MEKNKAWLLPLLGVGLAAVVYLNFHTASPAPAEAANGPAPVAPAPPATAPAAPQPAPAAGGGDDLWADLKALAKPPEAVLEEDSLRIRCREQLDPLLDGIFPTGLPRPGAVREAPMIKGAAPAGAGSPAPAPVNPAAAFPPMPELGFILSGPDGLTAWFGGQPCRTGEALPGGVYRVAAIHWNRVAVVGPTGKTVVHYTDSHRNVAGSRPIVEAP